MDKKEIELKIEELEERIAPARLIVAPPPFHPSTFPSYTVDVGDGALNADPQTPVFDHPTGFQNPSVVSVPVVTFIEDV